jgi:hypothetical protein
MTLRKFALAGLLNELPEIISGYARRYEPPYYYHSDRGTRLEIFSFRHAEEIRNMPVWREIKLKKSQGCEIATELIR